jgi:tetratricopeptide (TPR) repeat protein
MAPSRQDVVQSAEKLVARGRLEAAIDEYRKVLEASPNDTATLNRVGDLYARLNRPQRATELFRRTAENFARQGFFVKAIAIYKKIIRLDASHIAAYESLADLYHKQGLTNDALAQYQVVADYYVKHGDLRSATGVYRSMIGIDPNPSYRLRLGGLLQELRDTPAAMEQYDAIARLMLEHSRPEEAAQVYTSALDLGAASPEFLANAARALQEAGHLQGADRVLQLASERMPGPAAVARSLLARETEAAPVAVGPVPSWVAEEQPPVPPPAAARAAAVEPAVPELAAGPEEEVLLDLDSPELAAESLEALIGEAEAVGEPPAQAPAELPVEAAAEFAFELELEEEPPAPAGGVEVAADARPLEIALKIDRLLLDAEVLARYQMEELAVAALEQALELDPDHVEALGRLIDLQLALSRSDEALAMANRFALLAERGRLPAIWERVLRRMEEEGFLHEEGRFLSTAPAPPEAPPPATPAPVEPPAALPAEAPVGAILEEIFAEQDVAAAAAPMTEAPPPPSAPAVEPPAPAAEEIPEDLMVRWRREIAPQLGALVDASDLVRPAPPPPQASAPVDLSSLATELLSEVGGEGAAAAPSTAPLQEPGPLLERPSADEFFDLATELEAELLGEDLGEDLLPPVQEQTIEEIVEGFRRGMEKSLSPEDFDTHYNLGIAYQEMGLIDEAIGEFQLAAKDPRYLVECCSLLAACFQEKGYPELAVHWYERGLESPSLREEERLGLLYELGSLELALDERESARRRFAELYGLSSTYRDVVAKLEELGRPPS